jgi:hypothetical protein
VGDEVRIPIESRIEAEPGHPDAEAPGDGASPGHGSSSRVVHEPSRWTRAGIVVAVVALVGAGVALVTRGDGSGNEAEGGNGEANDAGGGAQEFPAAPGGAPPAAKTPGSSPQAATARAAFAEAVLRLERAGSFAYRGSVHAAAASPFRPGTWTAPNVTVNGEVVLSHLLSHEVAVDPSGAAVETVTSGPTVWNRTAVAPGGLPGAEWTAESPRSSPLPLGMAAVVGRIGRAHNPRGEAPDAGGRRMVRGTFPMSGDGDFGELLSGADLLLTLDDSGDIARVVITSAPVDPQLVMAIDIMRLGELQPIKVPDVGDAAVRRTVPLDVLTAAGVTPIELGALPRRWTLTGAWVEPGATRPDECPVLRLLYRDPTEVSDGFIWLGVSTGMCSQGGGQGIGGEVPLTAGALTGMAVVSASNTAGRLSDDGDLAVEFTTDLSVEDSRTVLASLVPFDVTTDPAQLDGISPS